MHECKHLDLEVKLPPDWKHQKSLSPAEDKLLKAERKEAEARAAGLVVQLKNGFEKGQGGRGAVGHAPHEKVESDEVEPRSFTATFDEITHVHADEDLQALDVFTPMEMSVMSEHLDQLEPMMEPIDLLFDADFDELEAEARCSLAADRARADQSVTDA